MLLLNCIVQMLFQSWIIQIMFLNWIIWKFLNWIMQCFKSYYPIVVSELDYPIVVSELDYRNVIVSEFDYRNVASEMNYRNVWKFDYTKCFWLKLSKFLFLKLNYRNVEFGLSLCCFWIRISKCFFLNWIIEMLPSWIIQALFLNWIIQMIILCKPYILLYWLFSACLLLSCLISFLLFPSASVEGNTGARTALFLMPHWMVHTNIHFF